LPDHLPKTMTGYAPNPKASLNICR